MKKLICMMLVFTALFRTTACGNGKEEPTIGRAEKTISQAAETGTALTSEVQTEGLPEESAGENMEQEAAEMKLNIQVGDTVFTATMAENSSVEALKELMAEGPLTLHMSDYAGMEKGADLGVTLPQNNERMNVRAGDIILYQGRTFVIYYGTNSWSLTPIGKIDHVDAEELKKVLGTGDVTVVLSLK